MAPGTIDRSAQASPWRSVPGLAGSLSAFVGRKREQVELPAMLADSRLVTLTGPGGSGKTRLAVEVSAHMVGLDAPPVFVDLSPVTDPSLIAPTIAARLGMRAGFGEGSVDRLAEEIGNRRLLLVLDNLEQLPGAGPVVVELLAATPVARVLATSRAPLHVRGERAFPVEPLEFPGPRSTVSLEDLEGFDAVALFVDRAKAIDRRFRLNPENGEAIASICRLLDGLPLAIELAAGQLRMLTPEALRRRLEQGLPLPITGTADAPARQRTLRDTIAWSYDLLEPADRSVLARASVFVGGFGFAAAEAVLPDPADTTPLDVAASLGRLVKLHLLRVAPDIDGEPRFGILETIRQFAIEQVTAADREPLVARHARHFAELAEASMQNPSGPARTAWLRRVNYGPDLANVRAAVDWARDRSELELLVRLVAATPALMDDLAPGWEALATAERMAEGADSAIRSYLLERLALYAMLYGGDRRRCRSLFEECLELNQAIGDRLGTAHALRHLAAVDFDLGDAGAARDEIDRAIALATDVDDPLQAVRLLADIGSIYIPLHSLAEGIALAREIIDRSIAVDYRPTLAHGHDYLGATLLAAGEVHGAIAAMSRSVQVWRDLGEDPDVFSGLANFGLAYARAGQPHRSRELLREASRSALGHGIVARGIAVLEAIADWLGAAQRPDAATVCWGAIDATRAVTHDRTVCNDLGLFISPRKRDRSALRVAAYRSARAAGKQMSLPDALAFGLRALDETVLVERDGQTRGRKELTAREREVLHLLAAGKTDGEIAGALFISKKTAAVHVANIKAKLGARSRVEIVTTALQRGLVEGPRPATIIERAG